jgi:hypothetical protein
MLRKSLLIISAAAVVSAFVPTTAAAQDSNWNQRTYFTFSAPVELPGKTLPAGTYLFRLLDSPSNRHVIQVFDKDEKQIHITALAVPAQRNEPSDEPEVRFMEVAANQPAAIRTWWFPGRTIGHEFVYPKEQATRLAKSGKNPVLTVSNDASTAETMRDADLARVNESAETSTYSAEQAPSAVTGTAVTGRQESQTAMTTGSNQSQAPASTGRTESQAGMNTSSGQASATTASQGTAGTQRQGATPSATRAQNARNTRTELPRTATVLPLVALLGLGSLAGAAALRMRRK